MNISGPAAVAKPEMLFYAPGDLTVTFEREIEIDMYSGMGVETDSAKAAEWYRKAAEQGLGSAQYHLGRCYEGGHGVTKDLTKAAEWYQKAADKGYDKKLLQGCDVGSAVAAGAALAVTGLIWKILRG